MGNTIKAAFKTRRDAEMAVERLVQEHGIERTDVFIEAASDQNTAGTKVSGADKESGHPGQPADGAPALHGAIEVSVDVNDETLGRAVKAAFKEFGGSDIAA